VYEDNFNEGDGNIATVFIRLDKSQDTYERKVSDVLTLLAAIGGLHKALFAIGTICVSMVAKRVFIA